MSSSNWSRRKPVTLGSAFPALTPEMPCKPKKDHIPAQCRSRKFKPMKVSGATTSGTVCPQCAKLKKGSGPCQHCDHSDAPTGFRWTGTSWNGDHRGYVQVSDSASQKYNESFERACTLKNNLLRYQGEESERTRVIDDSCDWFDIADNPWMTKAERDAAAQRARKAEAEEKNAQRQVCLDFDFSRGLIVDSTADAARCRAQAQRCEIQEFLDGARR